MHDIRFIRENATAFDQALRNRGMEPLSARLIELDDRRRAAIAALQGSQERRNALSKEIGEAMRAKDSVRAEALKAEVAGLKGSVPQLEQAERAAERRWRMRSRSFRTCRSPTCPSARTRPATSSVTASAIRGTSGPPSSISRSAKPWA